MRGILIHFLLVGFFCSAFGQEFDLPSLKQKMWGSDAPFTAATAIPEKWSNESAVILYRDIGYFYVAKRNNIEYQQVLRKRIKLLDKSAIETYSEFSFAETFEVSKGFTSRGGKMLAAFKVIKPDGTEKEFDMDNAIDIEGEDGEKVKKIAIPDLEPGDILDYFYYIYEPFKASRAYFFSPVISTIQDKYPIGEQRISFQVENDFLISFNSYNGAPNLKLEEESFKDQKRYFLSPREKTLVYSIIDKDREKADDVRWLYSRRVLPIIKFRVVYTRGLGMAGYSESAFLGEEKEIKKNIYKDDVLNYLQYRLSGIKKDPFMVKHLKAKKLYKVKGKEKEMLEEAYYFERYNHIISRMEFGEYGTGTKVFMATSLGYRYQEMSFIRDMVGILNAQDIDFRILVMVPRYLGNLKQLLFSQELQYIIEVKLDKPYYLAPFDLYSTPGSFSEDLEGVTAFAFKYQGARLVFDRNKEMPISSHLENNSFNTMQLSINSDMKTISATRFNKETGHNKSSSQYRGVKPFELFEEDFNHFDEDLQMNYSDKRHNTPEYKDKIKTILEKEEEERIERLKEDAENEFEVSIPTYEPPRVMSLGRMSDNPEFIFQEEFEMEDLIKKAGPNYILEIPKLIGGQVGLEEKEINRKFDIFYDFPRSFDNEISLEIPEGYTIAGLNKLNKNIDNEMGYFISSASIEGSTLTIKTQKGYKTNFISVEDWPKAVEFLEAAFQFTQEKLLLKKG